MHDRERPHPLPGTSETEAAFIAALRRGDERAFARLVLRYQDRVFNVAYRMLGSREDARDVAQEVFITVYEKIGRFRGQARLGTWIYRVASNHTKNRIKYLARRHDRDRTSIETLSVQPEASRFSAAAGRPDEVLEGRRLEAFLKIALGRLDPAQREVVVLRDLEGLSYGEIGEVTGANAGTVKSRLHRGRAHLFEALERWRHGEDIVPPGSEVARDRPAAGMASEAKTADHAARLAAPRVFALGACRVLRTEPDRGDFVRICARRFRSRTKRFGEGFSGAETGGSARRR